MYSHPFLLGLFRLLIIAGYDFAWDLNTLEFLTRQESNFESVNKLAGEDSRKPKCLLVLCRRNIVKNIQFNYQISVESLLLPTVLKEYLSFKELDDFRRITPWNNILYWPVKMTEWHEVIPPTTNQCKVWRTDMSADKQTYKQNIIF